MLTFFLCCSQDFKFEHTSWAVTTNIYGTPVHDLNNKIANCYLWPNIDHLMLKVNSEIGSIWPRFRINDYNLLILINEMNKIIIQFRHSICLYIEQFHSIAIYTPYWFWRFSVTFSITCVLALGYRLSEIIQKNISFVNTCNSQDIVVMVIHT